MSDDRTPPDHPPTTTAPDPAATGQPPAASVAASAPPAAVVRWPWYLGLAIIALFVAYILFRAFVPHAEVDTDDAYVTAHFATVAPRTAGQIASIAVTDNQVVRAGQLLVTIDDRDLRTDLERAEAMLAEDAARADDASAQLARQPSIIAKSGAQLQAASTRSDLSRVDAGRYGRLASSGAGTLQQSQLAHVTLAADDAGVAAGKADLASARHELDSLRALRRAALAKVRTDAAAVTQARLNLSYTRIRAPIDGIVDQRTVQLGNYVATGTPLMVVVPLHDVYIVANFRELALRHMRPGQPARVHVDAYGIWLDARIDTLPAATGGTYSSVPPANATGNFTKIVQRLPVKVTVVPGQAGSRLLRVGMSVEVEVQTNLADPLGPPRSGRMPR